MKKSTISIFLLISALWPFTANAQDIPEPISEPQDTALNEIDNSPENTDSSSTAAPDTSVSETRDASEQQTSETPESVLANQLIAFFTGLDNAVSDKTNDCEAMADAIRNYYESQRPWIESLDYASVSIDSRTIDIIHEKSIEFGKKLSICYDEKSIPAMLRTYAGLGEEF